MSLFRLKGRSEEAFEYLNEALRLDPESHNHRLNMVNQLTVFNRHAESIEHVRIALKREPNSAWLHEVLARNLEAINEDDEALAEHRKAVELDNRFWEAHRGLKNFFLRRGRIEEAMAAWKKAIACNPQSHDWWYGYAELCLYHGREDEYRSTRSQLLARFGKETDPPIAERVSRTCLLRPLTGDELEQAASLADKAAAADPAEFGSSLEYFRFVQGLADFRRERFDAAAATMRGPASKALGPAPKLVLAMSLHQKGENSAAKKALAEAVAGHDWSSANVKDQNGWIYHSLRCEAEAMIKAVPTTKR